MSQVTTQRVDFLEKWTRSQHIKAIHQAAILGLDKIINMKSTHTSEHLGNFNHY